MFQIQRQRGIGLLELMLSMVIIAILTLMSIQIFRFHKMNTQTAKGVDEIQDIISIVSGLPNPTQVQKTHAKNNLNNAIIMSGELPQVYLIDTETIGTPWTNNTGNTPTSTLTVSIDTGVLKVLSSSDLPNWACQSLLDRFRAEVASDQTSGCLVNNKKGTLTLYFELNANQGL